MNARVYDHASKQSINHPNKHPNLLIKLKLP